VIYASGNGIDTVQITSGNDTIRITDVSVAAFVPDGANPDTFYVYAIAHPTPSDNTCRPYEEIRIIVNANPTANTANIELCGNGNYTADFDLATVENTVTGGATGITLSWFEDAALMNTIVAPATYNSGTDTVYAQVTNNTTNCSASAPVYLTVTTVEIGNYVWCDSILNGIQDASESPVDSLIVQIYTSGNLLIAQDTTDASGEYYFNHLNVDTTGISVDGSWSCHSQYGLDRT